MKYFLVLTVIASIFTAQGSDRDIATVGKKAPDYTFQNVLTGDKAPINLKDLKGKPVIIEFWATWCSPCISAMNKLETMEGLDQIEVLAVSRDAQTRLENYISSTKTPLTVIHDTTHKSVFPYQVIPHAVIINKKGIVEAITSPKNITQAHIDKLINGIPLDIEEIKQETNRYAENSTSESIYHRQSESVNISLSKLDRRIGNRRKILENEQQVPYSISLTSFPPWWLYIRSYQLTSPFRMYVDGFSEEELVANRYNLLVEISDDADSTVYQYAQKTLEEQLPFKTSWITLSTDTTYTLSVIDSTLLPEPSVKTEMTYLMQGPIMEGERISVDVLIGYLEEHTYTPVVDATGLSGRYDFSLNWQYEDPQTVNRELGKYGLKLSRTEGPAEITYLRISK